MAPAARAVACPQYRLRESDRSISGRTAHRTAPVSRGPEPIVAGKTAGLVGHPTGRYPRKKTRPRGQTAADMRAACRPVDRLHRHRVRERVDLTRNADLPRRLYA